MLEDRRKLVLIMYYLASAWYFVALLRSYIHYILTGPSHKPDTLVFEWHNKDDLHVYSQYIVTCEECRKVFYRSQGYENLV